MPKMIREAVIQTVTQSYDRKVKNAEARLETLADPDYYARQIDAWKEKCAELVTNLYRRVTEEVVTESELSGFRLPYKPDNNVEYETDRARRDIKYLEAAKERALNYINARVGEGEEVNLSQSELRYIGFHEEVATR